MTRPEPTPPAAGTKPQTPAPAQDKQDKQDETPAAPPRDTPFVDSAPPTRLFRWALLLVAVLLGAAVGALGSFGHRASATWLGVSWPTGLVLCFGGLIGLLLGIGELLEAGGPGSWQPTRLSAVSWASAGWLLALLWLTYLGPPPSFARKGDVVLANDWKSLAYLLGGMVLVTVAVYRSWVAALSVRLAARTGAPGGVHPKG